MLLFKIILSLLLLVGIINPKLEWKIAEGWKFKNVEPSTAYLIITRIASLITLILIWILIPSK
ncbi:MAG: histidine kinase [Clostridiaceae bacterium]|jgi:hypothetical protein|nr:histidine kinase [Clostridiaceae bacterium]